METCAPELFHHVSVHNARMPAFIQMLSEPDNRLTRFARRLTIRGHVPWLAFSSLLHLLPLLRNMTIRDNGWAERREVLPAPVAYSPASPRSCRTVLTARLVSLFLRRLILRQQYFSSSIDLLRLLGSFPRLTEANLNTVICRTWSNTLPIASTQLRELVVSGPDTAVKSPIQSCWRWCHRPADPHAQAFPGLRYADVSALARIMECIRWDTW